MSLAHGSALEEISGIEGRMETIDACGLDTATLRHLKECVHVHGFNKVKVIVHMLKNVITNAYLAGILDVPPPILSRVYQTISRGYVKLLDTKKIKDTKFPFPSVQLIALLLLLHSILSPAIVAVLLNSLVFAPMVTFVQIFGLHAMNLISMQLEDPFGEDANDLPLAHFQAEMNNCLLMLVQERLCAPVCAVCSLAERPQPPCPEPVPAPQDVSFSPHRKGERFFTCCPSRLRPQRYPSFSISPWACLA